MPVFLRGRRAFCIIPAPPTSPRPTLIQSTVSPIRALPTRAAPIRASPIRAAPAPLLPQPATPTLTSPPPLRLPPATPTLTSPPRCRRLRIPRHRTDRPSPAWSEMPPRTASLLQFCPEHRHGPRPFSCSTRRRTADPRPCSARSTKKADGTALRSVRRQKATNLSRQHHRGRSSGSPENRLF